MTENHVILKANYKDTPYCVHFMHDYIYMNIFYHVSYSLPLFIIKFTLKHMLHLAISSIVVIVYLSVVGQVKVGRPDTIVQ